MSIHVKIVTTANRTLQFSQSDPEAIRHLLETLRLTGHLFTDRTLIVGTDENTQFIATRSITRIEIATALDLGAYLPQLADSPLRQLNEAEDTATGVVSASQIEGRIDFFFEGGDTLPLWVSSQRPASASERMMRLNHLLDQPLIVYRLPEGGAGFVNVSRITRAQFAGKADQLPKGAWQLRAAP